MPMKFTGGMAPAGVCGQASGRYRGVRILKAWFTHFGCGVRHAGQLNSCQEVLASILRLTAAVWL